jgi:hypothetical protein
MVNQMLKRLSDSVMNAERKKKKNSCKLFLQGLTPKEIEDQQRRLLEGVPMNNDESDELYMQENTSLNETPVGTVDQQDQAQYWQEYKENWLTHNKDLLEQEYQNWVKCNIDYNVQNSIPDGIVDELVFMLTFTADSFFESQYESFL